jgi:hypothetical protein
MEDGGWKMVQAANNDNAEAPDAASPMRVT